MTSKKKKYREISRQQAEDLYKLGIEFQYRTKAGKGSEWKYVAHRPSRFMFIRVADRGCYLKDLFSLEDQRKCTRVFSNKHLDMVSMAIPILFEDSMQHHDEIADVLKIKFYYRTEVE